MKPITPSCSPDALASGMNMLLELCDLLPDDWYIETTAWNDEAGFGLYNPHDEYVDVCFDDLNPVEMYVRAINEAREIVGLDPVEWRRILTGWDLGWSLDNREHFED